MTGRRLKTAAPTDQDIYERIFLAVLERRLRPGAHLREVELAAMFGVSRTKVRQALAKLIQVGIAVPRPNRGAAVAAPSRGRTRQLFELRTVLEPAIAAQLAGRHRPADLARLRSHIAVEDKARTSGNQAALIRNTGEFHLLLAQLHGNELIHDLLKQLEALTCLAILSYARTESCACLPHEHRDIVEVIAARNTESVRSLMAAHLGHVLAELDLEERPTIRQDLSSALNFPAGETAPRR